MRLDEQCLYFRDAMASLSIAVNIITTEGDAGQCETTIAAARLVMDTPSSLMVCINANSVMSPVFQGNGKLYINVLNHEQELMVRHFVGMTGMTMEEHLSLSCWQKGPLAQPVLKGSLASLKGEIRDVRAIGTYLVYLVEIKSTILSAEGRGLTHFKCRSHPVMLEMEAAI